MVKSIVVCPKVVPFYSIASNHILLFSFPFFLCCVLPWKRTQMDRHTNDKVANNSCCCWSTTKEKNNNIGAIWCTSKTLLTHCSALNYSFFVPNGTKNAKKEFTFKKQKKICTKTSRTLTTLLIEKIENHLLITIEQKARFLSLSLPADLSTKSNKIKRMRKNLPSCRQKYA